MEMIKQSIAIDEARKAKKCVFNKLLGERRAKLKGYSLCRKIYSLNPKDVEIVSLLKGLYQTSHNDAKFQEMKAVEAALKAGK